jgi:hypothetical protein
VSFPDDTPQTAEERERLAIRRRRAEQKAEEARRAASRLAEDEERRLRVSNRKGSGATSTGDSRRSDRRRSRSREYDDRTGWGGSAGESSRRSRKASLRSIDVGGKTLTNSQAAETEVEMGAETEGRVETDQTGIEIEERVERIEKEVEIGVETGGEGTIARVGENENENEIEGMIEIGPATSTDDIALDLDQEIRHLPVPLGRSLKGRLGS